MSPEISAAKAALRAQIRAARAGKNVNDPGITAQLTPLISQATTVAGYIGYGDEPRITATLIDSLAQQKTILLPKLRDDRDLEWGQWRGEPLDTSRKLAEPWSGSLTALSDADLIIIPALAVDRSGNRLGQGGGSYDRALKRTVGKIVAVVFNDEVLDQLPCEAHDAKVSAVVTPSRTLFF